MAPCLLVTKSIPRSVGGAQKMLLVFMDIFCRACCWCAHLSVLVSRSLSFHSSLLINSALQFGCSSQGRVFFPHYIPILPSESPMLPAGVFDIARRVRARCRLPKSAAKKYGNFLEFWTAVYRPYSSRAVTSAEK